MTASLVTLQDSITRTAATTTWLHHNQGVKSAGICAGNMSMGKGSVCGISMMHMCMHTEGRLTHGVLSQLMVPVETAALNLVQSTHLPESVKSGNP